MKALTRPGPAEEPSEKSKPSKSSKLASVTSRFFGQKPFIRALHGGALRVFESVGFQFEARRWGHSQVGLLRKPFTKTLGPKRRLVFIPGFGDTPLSWFPVVGALLPFLKKEFDEVIILDFPGFSGFLHDEPAFDSMDELQRCVRELLRDLKPDVLMGHSLGGWLASDWVAETAPELQPKKVILFDPSGVVGDEKAQGEWRERFDEILRDGPTKLRPHVFRKEPLLVDFFEHEFFHFLGTDEIKAFIRSIEPHHLVQERLAQIPGKVILIWGDSDTLIPTALHQAWEKGLKNVEAILIKNCGHSPQLEKPGITIALLTEVLLGKKLPGKISARYWTTSYGERK